MSTPNLDSVTTIADDGSRRFLHPADARGRLNRWRRCGFAFLIALYVVLPWIPINGAPAVFLNVAERKFHLFGMTFVPQDLWLVFFLLTGLGFGLFYVTALFGRVWCGWACPQTVWLDGVYRRIERWIEGDPNRRHKLDASPWTAEKFARRGGKHVAFVALSLLISHIFMSYFVSVPGLYAMVRAAPVENWTVFLWVFVTAGILYFNFAWFREQLCIVVCPYGRLQSALIDDDSIVIGYDAKRGEPRGKVNTPGAGDCVDCFRCVSVCPTGIDIRQGLQMECLGCTACIDACDDVMTRLNRPTGLIRHASMRSLGGEKTRWVRSRTIVYTVLLLAGAAAFLLSLSRLQPFNASVLRVPGAPYYSEGGVIRNQFQVRIVNKMNRRATFAIALEGAPAGLTSSGSSEGVRLEARAEAVTPLFLALPISEFDGTFPVTVVVEEESGSHRKSKTVSFLGPEN